MSEYLKPQPGHCFICSSETVNSNFNSDKRNLCEKFCILVGRYLNFSIKNNSKSSNFKLNFKKTLNKHRTGNELEVFCCDSCFVEVEIFCVVFEQFSLLQLELNVGLGKIVESIKNRNPLNKENEILQRKTNFVEKFRNAVVSRVEKRYKNFPRLQLTNLKQRDKNEDEPQPLQIELPQEKANQVTNGGIIKQDAVVYRRWPTNFNDLNHHLPFKCRICGKGFSLGRYRTNHELRHVNPYSCRFCGRRFSHKVALDTHENIHTEGTSTTQYMCFVCKNSFLRLKDCKLHITKMHNKVGKILKIIRKQKSETVPTVPSQLPLASSSSTSLNSISSLEKPNIIGQGQGDNDGKPMIPPKSETILPSELPLPPPNVNAGESVDKPKVVAKVDDAHKPFRCPICGKGFYERGRQIRHEVVHNEARPHECPYCGKGFKLKQTMQAHKRSHFGVKPFQCSLCFMKFTRSTHCRIHQRKIHGVTDGVVLKENVDIPKDDATNLPSSSAPVLKRFVIHRNDNPATEEEGQEDMGGHNDLQYVGSCIVPAIEMTDGVEMEESEPHIKSEFLGLEGEHLETLEGDLCDPLAGV